MTRDLLRPWRRADTWWSLTHVVANLPMSVLTFTMMVVLLPLTFGMLALFPVAVVSAWVLFLLARLLARVERSRFAALLGVELGDPVAPLRGHSWWARFKERFRSWARWREILYHLLRLPMALVTAVPSLVVWCVSAALIGLPLYVGQLPGGTAKFGLFEVGSGGPAVAAALVGVVGLVLLAPWTTLAAAWLDTQVARRLLGPGRRDRLGERIDELETSRAAAVDSAEAERRRIERDLHDGAQQRLVSLAMSLGAARERFDEDPEAGRVLLAEAHENAKTALKELRDLVRGIHPAILSDRGLDAALSAVVAGSPVPVSLDVDIGERPPPAVEAAAYFVVAEALTNVARHADATHAAVTIQRAGDRLVVEVRDDGRGGADPSAGTGLQGVRDRVTGLGGTMHLLSPVGGPTTVLVELPCGS